MNPHTFDPTLHTGPLPSPCISVCQMNRLTGLCEGCWRTIDEIVDWSVASEAEKLQIWTAIGSRSHPP
jgi:predicted Fe-S protein YdhL (DUF1289 family)